MSLLPLLMSLDNYDQLRHQRARHHDLDVFALGMTPQEIHILANLPSVRNARQQQRDYQHDRLGEVKPQIGKDGFQVLMDVQQFQPNEISVKTVDNNTVIVEGKHEERDDEHGSVSRQFLRKYQLPKGYDVKDVISTLSSDGVLTIKAPPPQKSLTGGNVRLIQIQQTGPAHLNIKENPSGADAEVHTKSAATAAKKNGN